MKKALDEALVNLKELSKCLIFDMSIEVDDYDEADYSMSYEYIDFNGEGLQFNDDIKQEKMIDFIKENKIDTIYQALIKAQEQEKVLKVILKKQVDINEIKIMISNLKHCDDIERCKRYNASRKVGYKLKQDEFNSIKEMLEQND